MSIFDNTNEWINAEGDYIFTPEPFDTPIIKPLEEDKTSGDKSKCFLINSKVPNCFSIRVSEGECFYIKVDEEEEEDAAFEETKDLSKFGILNIYGIHTEGVNDMYILCRYKETEESEVIEAALVHVLFQQSKKGGVGDIFGVYRFLDVTEEVTSINDACVSSINCHSANGFVAIRTESGLVFYDTTIFEKTSIVLPIVSGFYDKYTDEGLFYNGEYKEIDPDPSIVGSYKYGFTKYGDYELSSDPINEGELYLALPLLDEQIQNIDTHQRVFETDSGFVIVGISYAPPGAQTNRVYRSSEKRLYTYGTTSSAYSWGTYDVVEIPGASVCGDRGMFDGTYLVSGTGNCCTAINVPEIESEYGSPADVSKITYDGGGIARDMTLFNKVVIFCDTTSEIQQKYIPDQDLCIYGDCCTTSNCVH